MGLFETRQTTKPLFQRDTKSFFQVLVSNDDTGDTNSIHEAVKLLGKNGGTIMIRNGTYNLKKRLDIPVNNITIIGEGEGTIITQPTGSAYHLIYASAKSNIRISNLKIVQDNDGIRSGINLVNCNKFKIEGVIFDIVNVGITISGGTTESIIYDCEFNVDAGLGISLYGVKKTTISNNRITCTNEGQGIQITAGVMGSPNSEENLIYNNIMKGDSTATIQGTGIYLNSYCDKNQINNNTIVDFFVNGINISHASCDDNTILNNLLENTTNISNSGTNTLIADNQLL